MIEYAPLSPIDPRADEAMVPMRDGVRLATDVYLPEQTSGRLPAIMARTPYDKGADFTFLPRLARIFNDRGYAFVAQDVRGKARSEGALEPFRHEVQDGYDTLDWLAAQSWSNGSVGMFGDSYLGYTSIAGAVSGHPALRAIVPRMMGTNRIIGTGMISLLTAEWAGLFWLSNLHATFPIDWSVRPLSRVIPAGAGRRVPAVEDMMALQRMAPADAKRYMYGTATPIRSVAIPTLHWTGYWDVLATITITDYLELQAESPSPDQHHLRLDAIDHEFYPVGYRGTPPKIGEPIPDAVLDELMPRYAGPVVSFFDHHLLGRAAEIPGVQYAVAHDDERTAALWPPTGAGSRILYFAEAARALQSEEGGRLAPTAPDSDASLRWVHDPANPVPNLVGNQWSILAEWPDERGLDRRGDVVTFTSEALASPLDLTGPARVRLALTCAAGSTHVVVKLLDVDPEGASRRLLLGATRVENPSREAPFDLDLGHIGYRVRPGHRLRVQIASSCFPLFAPHPGTDEDPWEAETTRPREQTLWIAGERAGWLELTVA
jgi:uncharacterized protein